MPQLIKYAGSLPNHSFQWAQGDWFTVGAGKTVVITGLGCYGSNGSGAVASGVTITVNVALRSEPTTILATMTFTTASPGTYDSTNNVLYKALSSPVTLTAGDYCVWAHGFGATFQSTNSSQPTPGSTKTFDTQSGDITWNAQSYSLTNFTTMPTVAASAGVYFGGPSIVTGAIGQLPGVGLHVGLGVGF